MGYKRKTLKLIFGEETGDLAGLEVQMRRPTVDHVLIVSRMKDPRGQADLTDEDLEAFDRVFTLFGELLIGWNLEEEDGTPIPATAESLRAQDVDFVYGVIGAWMEKGVAVSAPLERRSSGGEPSEVLSIPMEPLSENPGN